MKTIHLVIGAVRFTVAHIEDEFVLYEGADDFENDRDFWMVDEAVNTFLANPFAHVNDNVKALVTSSNKSWTIEVIDYAALPAEVYKPAEIEARRNAARRKHLLAQMSPEDRELFK